MNSDAKMDPIEAGLQAFSIALARRFELGAHTSEDAVRYTCFHSLLLQLKCGPERLVLEYPHPGRERALVDAWILSNGTDPEVALEFKFHRAPKQVSTAMARPMLAGTVFADIFKLAAIPDTRAIRRILVYVAGPEMTFYWSRPANGLDSLFELPQGETLPIGEDLLQRRALTLRLYAGQPVPTSVRMLHRSAAGAIALRALEVTPALPAQR